MPPSDQDDGPGPENNDNNPTPPNTSNNRARSETESVLSFWRLCTVILTPRRIIDEMKLTRTTGRGIRRLVTLCGTVTQLVDEYDRRLLDPEPDDDGDESDDGVSPENKAEVQRLAFPDILLIHHVSHELTVSPQASRSRLSIIS